MAIDRPYNEHLDPEDQVDAEEMIAAMVFDRAQEGEIGEAGAAQLGRDILNAVLWNFRRDLFNKPGGKV